MSRELHIASCVAHVMPERRAEIVQAIRDAGLAEVAADDSRGRLVVLIERSSAAAVLDAIDAVRDIGGVIAVNLVYQHAEEERAMLEPVDEPHAP